MSDQIMVKVSDKNKRFREIIDKIENEGFEFIKDGKVLELMVFKKPEGMDTSQAKKLLESFPFVKRVEEDYKVKINQNYPENFDEDLWNMTECRFQYAWETHTGSLDTSIAIIDNGIDADHKALEHAVDVDKSYDFVEGEQGISSADDHGTHVAGTTTGYHDGFVGANWTAEIVGLRALDSEGEGYVSDIVEAVEYAAGLHPYSPSDYRADVINMSLGSESDSSDLKDAIQEARDEGCIIVAAAGNDADDSSYSGGINYPADYEEVIAVGALDKGDPPSRASYSNYGDNLDVTAPGSSIKSTQPNDTYGYMSGTSMASPLVAGLVALMIDDGIDPDDVRNILHDTAIDLGSDGFDKYYGYGMINANWALSNIKYIHVGLGEVVDDEPEFEYKRSYTVSNNNFNLDKVIPDTYDLIMWVDSNRDDTINSGDSYYTTEVTIDEGEDIELDNIELTEVS